MELEYLDFEIRDVDDETRTVSGLAIPYNKVVNVKGRNERMSPNAFDETVGQPLYFGHDHKTGGMPIGHITKASNTDEGLHVTAQISNTAKGNEVRELLKDGTVKNFSVGFAPVTQSMQDNILVRTKADLKELSVTPFPAYAGAAVTEVREEQINQKEIDENRMENEKIEAVSNEVAELRETVKDLERKTNEAAETNTVIEPSLWETRSIGEIARSIQKGELSESEFETRAYTGGTMADVGRINTWIDREIDIMRDNRVFLNLWNKTQDPGQGNVFTYPKFSSTLGSAATQTNEGDVIQYTKLVTTTANVTLETIATYAQVSRQEVDRMPPSYFTALFKQLAYNYAKLSNAHVRTAVTGAATGSASVSDPTSPVAWINGVFDARNVIEQLNLGLTAEFLVCSPAVLKSILNCVDGNGRPVFSLSGQSVNSVGNGNVIGLKADIAGLPVVYDPGMTGTTCYVSTSQAVGVIENAGAPNSLQFQDIVSLFNDFSLYGYLAEAVYLPAAIVAVTT